MQRRTLSLAAGVTTLMMGLAACGGSTAAGGGERTILRLALNQTETHPSYIALADFGQRLEQATGGRYSIDIFANEMLGAQQEILNLQRNGIVDLAIISSTQLENINQDFRVFNVPRVFDSVEHQTRVINDPAITGELFHSLQDSNNLVVLGGFTQGERSVYAKKAVNTPADMSGLKVRVQESPVMLNMIRAMRGNPTPMAYGEVYTALQAGVIDGAENNEVSYFTQKHYEVAPHFSYTKHLVGLDYMVASSESLEEMSPEDRAIFDTEWTATWQYFLELWQQATQEAIDGATAGGATFHEDVDLAAFDALLQPVATSSLTSDVQQKIFEQTRAAAGK